VAYKMSVSGNYGTHLPCLIKALSKTTGDVLELGMGVFSTPYLHYQCILSNRLLVSYENYKNWWQFFIDYHYPCDNHEVNFIENYTDANINKKWDVVLIDQTPDSERVVAIKKLAKLAKYIIIHDSNPSQDKNYHYSEIYPLFKYRIDWQGDRNQATVLSNFVNLKNFWK